MDQICCISSPKILFIYQNYLHDWQIAQPRAHTHQNLHHSVAGELVVRKICWLIFLFYAYAYIKLLYCVAELNTKWTSLCPKISQLLRFLGCMHEFLKNILVNLV